jgi:RNA polymerase sigma factor (sigma-70 family)
MAADPRSDDELLLAWRAGDTQAGERLYDRHAVALARFFRNKFPNEVEDLIQQTFLALVESRERFVPGRSFRAYLLGIARYKLIDRLRELGHANVELEDDSLAALTPGPSTLLARKREQRLLLEGLRRIPVEHQIALELAYWEGLNAAEIAQIVGISHSAMRSRMSKARALLERALAELADSGALLDSTIGGIDCWAAEIRARL